MTATTYLEISPKALAQLVSFLDKAEIVIARGGRISLPQVAGSSQGFIWAII